MDNNLDTNIVDSTELLDGEVLPRPVTAVTIYNDVLAKKKILEAERKKKKKDNKGGSNKSKKELELDVYDTYLENYNVSYPNSLNPFLHEQNRLREGNVIPEELKMNLYEDSGFFFGMKYGRNEFIGKPAKEEGHIMGIGLPGSGKTMASVIPSMMTWRGIQIIIDVKGDLPKYWMWLNKHTGKKLKIFDPGAPKGASSCYNPFAPLRHGGPDKVPGNARDLALALMPMLPSVKDPVWIEATQNFLTGAIIYHFEIGCSFVETMVAIQLSSITEMIEEINDDETSLARMYMSKLGDVQEKVIGNIGMELSKLAALVTDPAMLNIFCTEDESNQIDWADLNTTTEPFDIILKFTEANMDQWQPLMKMMINQLIKSLEQRPPRTYKAKEAPPVLVMLDEFTRLGKISAIKSGLRTLRSRGITFAIFIQSFADLDEIYGSVAARVIADICAYKIVFRISDVVSQEYFSKAVGTTESTLRNVSVNHDPLTGRPTGYGRNINETREPIIYPEEFLTQKDVVLITPYGFCRVNKILFIKHRDTFLMPQLLKNPDYVAQNPLTYSYNPEGGQ